VNPAETFLHVLIGDDDASTSLYIRLDLLPVAGPGPLTHQDLNPHPNTPRVRAWLSMDPNRANPEGA
jgi:hypothetical protein